MSWIPIFSISSLNFEEDLEILKKIFNGSEKKMQSQKGYKFSDEAQFAMGWWFYDVYLQEEFIKKIVEVKHMENNKIKDERGILELIQKEFKKNKSKARIKFHGKKPFLARYWSWLMK